MTIASARMAGDDGSIDHKTDVGRTMLAALRRQRGLFLSITLGFPFLFNLLLLAILVARFGDLPNYLIADDWFENVLRIIAGTASISDMVPIILDEWVLEVGYMNYTFGNGVSEWSLLIVPHKLAIVTVIGALIGINFALVADQAPVGTLWRQCARTMRSGLLTGIGTVCASVTSVTLFWVICHSGPSWVVSLAVLGVDIPTALRLEPLGPALMLAGMALLVLSAILILRDSRSATAPVLPQQAREAAPC